MTTRLFSFLLTISCFLTFIGQEAGVFNLKSSNWYLTGTQWDKDEFKATSKEYFQSSSYIGKIDASGYEFYKVNSNLSFKLGGVDHKQFFVRQEGKKVYVRTFTNEHEEYLLYDFDVNVGDEIQSVLCEELSAPLIVTSIEEEYFGGFVYTVINSKIKGQENGRTYKFIEGIGTPYGFLVNLTEDTNSTLVLNCMHSDQKLCFNKNGDCPEQPKKKGRPSKK